jgi:hypothetical protein
MTGVLGIIIVRMGTKLDVSKQLHHELLRKRLQLCAFKSEWAPSISSKLGDHEEQQQRYEALMKILGREIRGA